MINVPVGETNFHAACSKTENLKTIKEFDVFALIDDKKIYSPKKNTSLDDEEYTIHLCYPLSVALKVTFKAKSLYEIINNIRAVYKKIYKQPDYYGIWGHVMEDLSITSIKMKEGNILEINIDS